MAAADAVFTETEGKRKTAMNKHKILLVDDSSMNRAILASMLEDGYELLEAEDGLQAIDILERQVHDISLILLDIVMPVCDGYGVLAHMKQRHWTDDVPVIVISAESSPDFINRAYDMGAADYIGRPFEAYVVQRRVQNIIALYEKQKKLAAIVANEIFERTRGYDRMVALLSQVVEFRNQESGLHVLHINLITEMLIRQLMKKTDRYGLKPSDVHFISTASSLHDIGKITVPDAILNKPGRLTPEEFEVIKTHSAEGAKMLDRLSVYRNDPVISTARDICRWHHERYDGRGYPDGLVGDAIPISAQVVSLADVYDALTSERCYKKAFSHERALEMILDGQCGAFNPLLLECLLELGDQIPRAMNGDPAELKERRELMLLTEGFSQHEVLETSTQLMRQLQFEKARADYFEKAAGGHTFVFKREPPSLVLSPESAARLGVKEVTPDPLYNEVLRETLGRFMADWICKQRATTPEAPDFTLDGRLRIDGREAACRCVCHVIWSDEDVPKYLGAVGSVKKLENTGRTDG